MTPRGHLDVTCFKFLPTEALTDLPSEILRWKPFDI
jgi:hypothetical protein